jgi:hypothetical protein
VKFSSRTMGKRLAEEPYKVTLPTIEADYLSFVVA